MNFFKDVYHFSAVPAVHKSAVVTVNQIIAQLRCSGIKRAVDGSMKDQWILNDATLWQPTGKFQQLQLVLLSQWGQIYDESPKWREDCAYQKADD